MKSIWYEQQGTAQQVLQFGERPDPSPAAGEVRVRLAFSGVNPIDVKRRLGGRGAMTESLVIPHFDGSGKIDSVGEGVSENRLGERVWVYGAQWQREYGTAAEYVALPADLAVQLPESTSYEQGACLGIPALTAHRSVFIDGEVAGQTILVTGGAGAVGRYAVQFAKLGGARVITTVSSEAKSLIAKSAGADHVINYKEEDVVEKIHTLTDGGGIDRVVEVEFGQNLLTNIEVLKPGGTIVTYASQADPEPRLPFVAMMYKSLTVRMVVTFGTPKQAKTQAIADITDWLSSGKLSHHIGQKFELADTISAHEAVEQGAVGKVLVKI